MTSQVFFQRWSELVLFFAGEFWRAIASLLPNLIGALVLLLVGLYVARVARRLTEKAFELTGLNKFSETRQINELLKKAGVQASLVEIAASIVYWMVVVIFVLAVSEILGLRVVAETLNRLIAYIPRVVGAVVVLILTFAVARIVRETVAAASKRIEVVSSQTLGKLAGGAVVLFGVLIATSQLGFDVSIISANLTLIIAGVVATIVLAVGIGSKALAANYLASYYTKQWFKPGQVVNLAGFKGKVKEVNTMVIVLETDEGEVIVPNKEVVERGS